MTYAEHIARNGGVMLIRIYQRYGVVPMVLRKSCAGLVPTTFLPQNRPNNRQNQVTRRTSMIEQERLGDTRVGS